MLKTPEHNWFLIQQAHLLAGHALSVAQTARVAVASNIVYWRSGTPGGTVPGRASIGPTAYWSFAVSDLVYAEVPVLDMIDTTQDIILGVRWFPVAAEAGKKVTWQLDIGLEHDGTTVDTIEKTLQAVDVAVSGTQWTYTETVLSLAPADWVTTPLPTHINVRLTRLASSADPVNDPGVSHLRWTQTLQL